MSGLFKKIKTSYDKIRIKQESYSRGGIRPRRDWEMLIVASFVVLIILSAVAFYLYDQIDKGQLFTTTEDDAKIEVGINNNLLKKVVDEINSRKSSLDALKSGKSIPSDPSL